MLSQSHRLPARPCPSGRRAAGGLRRPEGLLAMTLFFISSVAFAETPKIPETLYQAMQKNAENAIAAGDKKEADFWMARYLGLSSTDPGSGHSSNDLDMLIKKRKLAPKGFISSDWDKDFIEWFEKSIYPRWGADENKIRTKQHSFVVAETRYQEKYFVTVVAYPELELWHVVENGLVSRPLLLVMGSFSERPTLFFGKIFKGAPSFQFNPLFLDTKKRSLHYVWKPEFYDLDQDGIPEVWVRFNISWGNGFSQILDIYRIHNDSELVLLKRFQSGDEGFVRRLSDGQVELGSAFGSQKIQSRLSNDRHHLETWQYQKGEFKKISEQDVPFLLKSSDWKNYFLKN